VVARNDYSACAGDVVGEFCMGPNREEAITWLKGCPNPMTEDSDVEIPPIFSPEDIDELMTHELQQQHAH
jgi:hypothetical protein